MKATILLFTALGITQMAMAGPLLDVSIGINQWQPDYKGDIGDSAGNSVNLSETLGFEKDDSFNAYVTIKIPFNLAPNIHIQHTKLDSTAENVLTTSVVLDGNTYTASSNISSELELTHTDITFYWGMNIPYLAIDLGATIRQFDGQFSAIGKDATNETITYNPEIDEIIPLLYGAVRIDIPSTRFYGFVSGNFIGDGDNSFEDSNAAIGYGFNKQFGVELGYRSLQLDIQDLEDYYSDSQIEGIYSGIKYTF